ncbi:MAG: SgcJ/EcaC family oxidoreductase [Candidatus Competibacteraceae bacterium]|jgi:uncharacterized protein (TIGR02246 family)|nr:SgcJ/EcaC family oxidoreductase [Candidatus Competibacteraceae bacterium]
MGMKNNFKTALVAAVFAVSGAALAEVDEVTVDAVRTLWQNQHQALDAHDVDKVMATFADRDDIMLMGTGPGEHWVGPAEVKEAYAQFMKGFEANTMESKCGEGHGAKQDNVVWFTAVCTFTQQAQEQTQPQFVANLSAVVVKQDDSWRFHSMHFSHLTGKTDQKQ